MECYLFDGRVTAGGAMECYSLDVILAAVIQSQFRSPYLQRPEDCGIFLSRPPSGRLLLV